MVRNHAHIHLFFDRYLFSIGVIKLNVKHFFIKWMFFFEPRESNRLNKIKLIQIISRY